jgi:hypothetical protein
MSEEERVIPFEKAQDVFPMKVTPNWGKGALGTWRSQGRPTGQPGILHLRTDARVAAVVVCNLARPSDVFRSPGRS